MTEVMERLSPRKGESLVDIEINLAPNAECLTVNGVQYWHGRTYKVDPGLARTLNEMSFRTWQHERSINGANENQYRRPLHHRLSGRG